MNLPEHDGLRFYEFDQIEDGKSFKRQYSKNLDSLPINQTMVDLIVEEANQAFHWNMKIFEELEGNLIAAENKPIIATHIFISSQFLLIFC